MNLTQEAKEVLFALCQEYSFRREQGFPKSKAKNFVSASFIHSRFFPDWFLEDIEDALRELGKNSLLQNYYADGTVYQCQLSDQAVGAAESIKGEKFKTATEFVVKFLSLFL